MSMVPWLLIAAPTLLLLYTYLAYPLLLWLLAGVRRPVPSPTPDEWPSVSITVPVYNEEAQIRSKLEELLALDYPVEKRQILVLSDASTDRTDEIVREFASQGVELVRLPQRGGKGAAEKMAALYVRGEIVVNTDASTRIPSGALKHLVAQFADPTVGVASGRDVSASAHEGDSNAAESDYVGYEMQIRALETRLYGIVGASGCFYGIRAPLYRAFLPDSLSRDFAAALVAREHGYRAVSAHQAVCLVPRTASLQREYHRKVRTMTRGMRTLWYKRHLLNPFRYGVFSWMLLSHKLCRWLVPWALLPALLGLAMLGAREVPGALWICAGALACAAVGSVGWAASERYALPPVLGIPAYLLAGNVATLQALLRAVRGSKHSIWEPTRREVVTRQ